MHRLRPFIVATVVALLTPALASAVPPPRLEVRGRVTDESSSGVEGVAVRFLQGRRDFKMLEWEYTDEILQEVVVRTDRHGFFEATLNPDPNYRYFWLRFYDPETFDVVRYVLPEDVEVSERVRQGRRIVHSIVLLDHPDWPQVQAWIQRLGPESPRGQVVRRMGIPDRRERQDELESFWYQDAEVIYRFRDGKFIGEERWAASGEPATSG